MPIDQIIAKLNFNSWFDLWHYHVDESMAGLDVHNWQARVKQLNELLTIFEKLKEALQQRETSDYQVFCYISIKDPVQDSVYIHTKNPNQDNFPYYLKRTKVKEELSEDFVEFLKHLKYEYFTSHYDGADFVIVYDTACGVAPIKD